MYRNYFYLLLATLVAILSTSAVADNQQLPAYLQPRVSQGQALPATPPAQPKAAATAAQPQQATPDKLYAAGNTQTQATTSTNPDATTLEQISQLQQDQAVWTLKQAVARLKAQASGQLPPAPTTPSNGDSTTLPPMLVPSQNFLPCVEEISGVGDKLAAVLQGQNMTSQTVRVGDEVVEGKWNVVSLTGNGVEVGHGKERKPLSFCMSQDATKSAGMVILPPATSADTTGH